MAILGFPEAQSAATRVRDRIARDAARHPEIGSVLQAISRHFFETEFTTAALFRRVPHNRYRAIESFRAAFGVHVADYIVLARLEMACELLLTTTRSIRDIIERAGIACARSFDHQCRRFFGMSPGEVRKRSRQARLDGLDPVFSSEGAWDWQRGELDADLIADVEHRLDQIDRRHGLAAEPATPLVTLDPAREPILDLQLEPLLRMPRGERLALLRRGAFIASRAVLETLGRRSRLATDPDRGLVWAEMALAMLEGNLERLARGSGELLAISWARLGLARGRAADLAGADAALVRAASLLRGSPPSHVARAEVAYARGRLHLDQRRFVEAREQLTEAVFLSRETGALDLEIRALQERARLAWCRGQPAAGLPDLYAALERAPADDARCRLLSYLLLLQAHATDRGGTVEPGAAGAQRDEEISRLLPAARALAQELGDRRAQGRLAWIEALDEHARGSASRAERLLQQTRTSLARDGDHAMHAVVALELALRARAPLDVFEYAAEALPALDALAQPTAIEARKRLRRALAERRVERDVLATARACLLGAAL